MKVAAVMKIGNLKDPDALKRGKVELIQMDEQEVGDEDVKIRVAYCAICGSDPHVAEGAFGTQVPQTLGHEVSGVIEALGKKATIKGLKVGDRVAGNFLRFCGTCRDCQNGRPQFCKHAGKRKSPGMAETMVWHESQVYKLPDSVSLREGCMLEPVSIAVRAADKLGIKVGESVAISGGGPIGQLVLQVLHMQGATDLTLIEPIASRRALGQSLGAVHVIDPLTQNVQEEALRITDGRGFDAVADFSGVPSAAEALPAIVAHGGTLLYGAMYPLGYTLPLDLFTYCYQNELTITGIYLSPYTFPRAVQLLQRMNLAPFIETSFSLDNVVDAFATHLTGEHPKVLIRCNDLD